METNKKNTVYSSNKSWFTEVYQYQNFKHSHMPNGLKQLFYSHATIKMFECECECVRIEDVIGMTLNVKMGKVAQGK